MNDGYLFELNIVPSVSGLYDGLDPALPDDIFPATAAQQLDNVRVSGGKWQTRLGISNQTRAWTQPVAGSGAIRLFDVLYTSSGVTYRLLGRGDDTAGRFFKLQEPGDLAFTVVSGGTGLGATTSTQPYWCGVAMNDLYYFTDRSGALRRYKTTGTVSTVASPVAPTTAPRAKAWTFGTLDAWSGAAPFSWTVSDAGNTNIVANTTNFPPPMGTVTAELNTTSGSSKNDTITRDVTGESLDSHTIAFWWHQDGTARAYFQFGFGNNQADEFVEKLHAPVKKEWYPVYIAVGNLPTINKKRFKCIRDTSAQTMQVSQLFLPGRLEGLYRWIYTHYDPTSGDERESEPSAVSNSGKALDFSAQGVSYSEAQGASAAFQKSCMLDFTSDSGTDATTTKIRIYRSGGVPELTTGPDGRDVYYRVAEVYDINTTLSNSPGAGASSFTVASATNIAAGDWLVVNKSTSTEEYVKVSSVAGTTINLVSVTLNAHVSGQAAQIAYLDNTPNEAINVFAPVDQERDDPPSGSHWVCRSPDGRLVIARWASHPMGIAFSNKPTPDRPLDFQVFPDGVDPVTRANPTQGFRADISGSATGEEIIWGGFFRGLLHILTRNKLYRINALSQQDWGPNAVQKVLDVGCIAGETVQIHEGVMYWASEGPRVVRWDGEGREEVISAQRVNETLAAAQTQFWSRWFAKVYEITEGKIYRLFYDYQTGNNGVINALDFNITQNEWGRFYALDENGDKTAWHRACVLDGGTDINALVMVDARGYAYDADLSGQATDSGRAIPFAWKTKRVSLGGVGEMREVYLRLEGVTSDSVTLTVSCGGSDEGTITHSYSVNLAGSGDLEKRVFVERDLKGRWCEIQLSGSVSHRPAIRELKVYARPMRVRKATAD